MVFVVLIWRNINAHPHLDQKKKIALVHNGIIENYGATKVLLFLQRLYYNSKEKLSFEEGPLYKKYTILSLFVKMNLEKFRMGSPLVLGVGEGIISDASPIVEHTEMLFIFIMN